MERWEAKKEAIENERLELLCEQLEELCVPAEKSKASLVEARIRWLSNRRTSTVELHWRLGSGKLAKLASRSDWSAAEREKVEEAGLSRIWMRDGIELSGKMEMLLEEVWEGRSLIDHERRWPDRQARLETFDAVSIAQSLGWPEVGASIEARRLGEQARPGVKKGAKRA